MFSTPFKKLRVVDWLRLIGVFLFTYVVIYICDSMLGGYWGQPVSGKMMYKPGVRMPTLYLWQPYYGYADSKDNSILGLLFYPAIYVDQHLVHRSYDLANSADAKYIFSTSSRIKWNPCSLKEAQRLYLEKALWRNRCVENQGFCLENAKSFLGKDDLHFIALLILDKYGTNAINSLQLLLEKQSVPASWKNISNVIDEINKMKYEVKQMPD